MPADTGAPIDRLIFVYAASSGALGAVLDNAKKLLRVKGCTLCAITHGLAGEKEEWKECRAEIGVPVEYVHRDELTAEFRHVVGSELPCVLAEAGGQLVVLLTPEILERCRGSVPDLKGRLKVHAVMKGLRLLV